MKKLLLPPDLQAALNWLYLVGQAGSWNAPAPPPTPARPGNDNPAAQAFYDQQIAPNWSMIVSVYNQLAPFRTAAASPPSAYDQWLASGTMPSAP